MNKNYIVKPNVQWASQIISSLILEMFPFLLEVDLSIITAIQ